MSNNLVEALIGAVVLVVAAGFFWFTYERTDFGTVQGYHLTARFDRIDGLKVGDDVRLAGIKVGTVVDQEIDMRTYQAVVTLSIDRSVELPTDSSATVASEGLLGGNYLSLEPGGMDEILVDGDEVEHTQGSLDLYSLIRQAVFSSKDEKADGGSP